MQFWNFRLTNLPFRFQDHLSNLIEAIYLAIRIFNFILYSY